MKRLLSLSPQYLCPLHLVTDRNIPKPQKEIIIEGYFRLDKSCVINSNEKGSFKSIHQDTLIKSTGFAYSRKKNNGIQFYKT